MSRGYRIPRARFDEFGARLLDGASTLERLLA